MQVLTTRDLVLSSVSAPAMPAEVIEYLRKKLRITDCFLEYGAGGSTLCAVELEVPHVISIESDKIFLNELKIKKKKIISTTKFHPVYVNIGKTAAWGRPIDSSRMANWYQYSQAGFIWAERVGLLPDFVLIDGRFRVSCFLACLLSLKSGTEILFDDYVGRSKYSNVEKFVGVPKLIDRAAIFTVPEKLDIQKIAFALAKYSIAPG
jgi:hypothetical protein